MENKSDKKSKNQRILRSQNDYLVLFTSIFILGLVFSKLFNTGCDKWLLALFFLFWFASFKIKKGIAPFVFLIFASFISGAYYGNLRIVPDAKFSDLELLRNVSGTLTAKIGGDCRYGKNNILFYADKASYNYTIDKNNEKDRRFTTIPGRIKCFINNINTDIQPGRSYDMEGKFSFSDKKSTNGEQVYFRADKLSLSNKETGLEAYAISIRNKLRNALAMVLPKKYEGVVVGFVLGDTSLLSDEQRKLFREAGISHMLAVSGLHIMTVMLLFASLLYFIHVPPLSRILVLSLGVAFYALITVGSPSVWRALIMYIAAAVSLYLEVKPSPLRPVSIAALVILLIDPSYIYDMGFLLSFGAVLGIIVFSRPFNISLRLIGVPSFISRYLAVSFAANLGTMPLCACFFGAISTASVLVNPLITWALGGMIPLALIISVLALFSIHTALYLIPLLSLLLDGLFGIASWGTGIRGQYLYVGNVSASFVIFLYMVLLLCAALINKFQIINSLNKRKQEIKKEKSAAEALKRAKNQEIEHASAITHGSSDLGRLILNPPPRVFYPLRDAQVVAETDEVMIHSRRPSVKDIPDGIENGLQINEMKMTNQNLYYMIQSLDKNKLEKEPRRILQSQVMVMALVASEFMCRLYDKLEILPDRNPTPRPTFNVQDKYLGAVLAVDGILCSYIAVKNRDYNAGKLVSRLQKLFSRGYSQFERLIELSDIKETADIHLRLREDMFMWCKDLIDYDIASKKSMLTVLREKNEK